MYVPHSSAQRGRAHDYTFTDSVGTKHPSSLSHGYPSPAVRGVAPVGLARHSILPLAQVLQEISGRAAIRNYNHRLYVDANSKKTIVLSHRVGTECVRAATEAPRDPLLRRSSLDNHLTPRHESGTPSVCPLLFPGAPQHPRRSRARPR